MSSSGEEEETGPSVDSADPEERIKARRVRIQKRIEAKRRAEMGEDSDQTKEIKEELSKSRKQMEESRLRLTKLQEDGLELTTNIRVAGDSREAARRVEEDDNRRHRKERLEQENKAGTERFEEITRKWESALQKEIPQDLHEMLMMQKGACDAMIYEKNKLINDFQTELKQKDDQYVKDLKKQAEDIDLMIERMDEQVKQLTRADRDELGQVERAFVAERTDLMDLHKKKWESMMQQRRDKETDFMKQREKRVEDYEQQLQHLRVQDAEEYNMVKIKLETDVQILQQQLQQMKATYQLNQEKLEYNFQVLRKRDEENTITKSQQKRKITRLQDILTNLKNKLKKQEKMYKDENQQLTEDYKRITEQFKELQKKSKHFMATDAKKFHDVWVMNEDESKELVRKLLEQDRLIHEHQLGLPWEAPDVAFMDNTGPIPSEAAKRKSVSASQVVQEIMSSVGGASVTEPTDFGATNLTTDMPSEKAESRRSAILQKFSPRLIKSILELLCDESGFLIESKLNLLLSPLERDEQSLMKLDAIFSALGVDTEDDVQQLVNYFVAATDTGKLSTLSGSIGHKLSLGVPGELLHSVMDGETTNREDDYDREIDGVTGTGEFSPRSDRAYSMGQDLINANEVLKALKQFVQDNKQAPRDKGKVAQFRLTGMDARDDADDTAYWQSYPGVLPEKPEHMWDALVDGLDKYNEVCQNRSGLIDETDSLRQQNAELRMLLHQYVNSKVNQELEIPPTRVLQLELNPPQ